MNEFEAAKLQAVVRAHPRGPKEGFLEYIVRIAGLAGIAAPIDAATSGAWESVAEIADPADATDAEKEPWWQR